MLLGPLAAGFALAGVDVVVADGPLCPGRQATLEVAWAGEAGAVSEVPPKLAVSGGALLGEPVRVRHGVWRMAVLPDFAAFEGRPPPLSVTGPAGEFYSFPSQLPAAPVLGLPAEVQAVARDPSVTFVVTSAAELPPVDALEVAASEGQVTGIQLVAEGMEVQLALDDIATPRFVVVGVRDARTENQPAWTRIRVRAKARLPLNAEPGAKLTLKIGSRTYGPFIAAANGAIDARIEQYPGEVAATALLVDDLGNETRTDIPLVSQSSPSMAVLTGGETLPGRAPPLVHLGVMGPDGKPPRGPPECRSAAVALPLADAGNGHYVLPVPVLGQVLDLRAGCTVGQTSVTFRVPVASGVAERLSLRVWPDEVLADYPVADVSVVLDDVRGERLATSGVRVIAARGTIERQDDGPPGVVLRSTYDGVAAVGEGKDELTAQYFAEPGSGAMAELVVRFGRVAIGGGATKVYARALDARRRPLANIPIALALKGPGTPEVLAEGVTAGDGWATVLFDVGAELGVVRVRATAQGRVVEALAVPGEPGEEGPGSPDLVARATVSVRPGRVAGISIEVDPAVLRAGPGSVAWVTVRLEDGAGRPVTDEPIELKTTEGELGPLKARGDGSFLAEYTPLPVERARDVSITAHTATMRSTAHLTLEPRVVRLSVGPWVGGHTNFGALGGIAGGVDFDARLRFPLVGESFIVRLGVTAIGLRAETETGAGAPLDLRSTVVPCVAMAMLRQDRGPWSVWAGAGGTLAPTYSQVRFGETLVSEGLQLLVGPSLAGGAGHRAPGGEVVLTVQGFWLPAPRSEVGFRGNLGGLVGGVGYRLVY